MTGDQIIAAHVAAALRAAERNTEPDPSIMLQIPGKAKLVVFENHGDGSIFFSGRGDDNAYRSDWYKVIATTDDHEIAQEVCSYGLIPAHHVSSVNLIARMGDANAQRMIDNCGQPIPAHLLTLE